MSSKEVLIRTLIINELTFFGSGDTDTEKTASMAPWENKRTRLSSHLGIVFSSSGFTFCPSFQSRLLRIVLITSFSAFTPTSFASEPSLTQLW